MAKSVLIAIAALGLLSSGASAAPARAKVPPMPNAQNSKGSGKDVQAEFLARQYGISATEAAERVDVLRQVQRIVQAATASDAEGFGGVWVEQTPVFKIIVGFTGQSDRKAFLDALPPNLRRYVQVRSGAKSAAAAAQEVDQIMKAVAAAHVPFQTHFDPRSQNHILIVRSQADANKVRDLIPPSLRSVVNIKVGQVLHSFQTNVQTGDAVYGGWDLLNSNGNGTCSYAFPGRDSNGRDSILTAAHCSTNPPYVMGADGAHLVQLPAETENRYGDLYDFRYHPVVGLSTGYWVYFINSKAVYNYPQYVNTVDGFNADGYFTVHAALGYTAWNSNHYLGMPVCKSGFATGFTCGTVEANWVSGTDDNGVTYNGFVQVSGSSQPVIAFGGDSGAAVFSYPTAGYDIDAYGILKGGPTAPDGSPCTGSSCWYAYMPIDRINDRLPFQLYTTQGMVSP